MQDDSHNKESHMLEGSCLMVTLYSRFKVALARLLVQRMVVVLVSFSVLLPCAYCYHSVSATCMLVSQHALFVLGTNKTTSLVGWTEFACLERAHCS